MDSDVTVIILDYQEISSLQIQISLRLREGIHFIQRSPMQTKLFILIFVFF